MDIDGEPVTLSGGLTTFPMDQGDALDPAAPRATSLLFGLRDGLLVSGGPGALDPVTGPMGTDRLGVRSVGVDLTGTRVAGVSSDGARALLTDVRTDADVTPIMSGATDLLPPVWDFADRVWLLNRTGTGARVSVVRRRERAAGGAGPRASPARTSPTSWCHGTARGWWPSSTDVAVTGSSSAGSATTRAAAPSAARRLGEIAWDDQTRLRALDIGWSSPTSVVIAHRLTGDLHQVRTMTVDGAPAGLPGLAATVQERPRSLVSSPRTTDPVYVETRSGLLDVLSGSRAAAPDPELDVPHLRRRLTLSTAGPATRCQARRRVVRSPGVGPRCDVLRWRPARRRARPAPGRGLRGM